MTHETENRKEMALPRGAYSKIGRRMRPQVTPQHVRLVALGERKSARVSAAIQRYVEGLRAA